MKAALAVLVFLLIGSLATSGYLLMEQNNSRTVINAAQKNADEQKNMILAATELKIKAEHAQTKLTSDLKNTATQLEQLTNDMAKAELDFQLKAENHAAELQVTKVEIAEILSRLAEAESQAQKAATLTKENAIVRALTEAQGEALDRRGKELDAAVKQLKLFSATGLNPDEINALKKKRPIEPVTSRLARVKPIRPGKIITPLQK